MTWRPGKFAARERSHLPSRRSRAAPRRFVGNAELVAANRVQINILAAGARLPRIFTNRENVEFGGLMSYAPSFPYLYRRAADYVDKILRGGKPADLPMGQPIRFELVVNLNTAKAIGLAIRPTLLARADEVIE